MKKIKHIAGYASRVLILLGCFNGSLLFGQLHTYEYKQELKGITGPWHMITLGETTFDALASDLSDIRIYGITESDTIEAPYILKVASNKHSEKEVNFTLLNSSSSSNGYFFTYEIPVKQSINKIQLDFNEENFDWRVVLEASHDQRDWFTLLKDYRILAINNGLTEYNFTDLNFSTANYSYYRLKINTETRPSLLSAKLSLKEQNGARYNEYPVRFTNIDQEGKNTLIDIDLKSRLPLSQLKLDIVDRNDYYRPIYIAYVSDSIETEKGWKYTYRDVASSTLTSFENNSFDFETIMAQKLRVTIKNDDNQPLNIESATVKGFVHELIVRFDKPAKYYLAYGNSLAKKPYYDLIQAATKIPDDLSALTLGATEKVPKKSAQKIIPLFANKLWLWGVMALIIIVLGWFTFRMLKKR